jgi:hypothetical protein
MEVDRANRADRAGGEYTASGAVKAVRNCQKLSGQDGTCLGLLLLHVGPNGDGFGGQEFMEHYTIYHHDLHDHYLNIHVFRHGTYSWENSFFTLISGWNCYYLILIPFL